MASHHPSEPDSATVDSVASTPRSENQSYQPFPPNDPRVRFMCSFGGRILPRPHDNQLRYVGGETRIVAIHRSTSFSALQSKLSKLSNIPDLTLKYQLPNEDLDALISVTTDEDIDNMIEEYDRLAQHSTVSPTNKTPRLRLFLFPCGPDLTNSTASSIGIGSLLDGSSKRESWFLDALNGGGGALERGRSESSSLVSDMPDYLFGLDNNSDESKAKTTRHLLSENVSVVSDPGSPLPPASSPYCSTSSAIPDLPPVKTRLEKTAPVEVKETQNGTEPAPVQAPAPTVVPHPTGFAPNPVWHYMPQEPQVPVYYVPAGNHLPIRPVQMHVPYTAHGVGGQFPAGLPGQMYGTGVPVGRSGEVRPMGAAADGYDFPAGMIPVQVPVQDGVMGQQQVCYAAARNPGAYPTAEMQGAGSTDMMTGRVPVQVSVQDGVVGQQQVYYAAARNPGAYPTAEMQGAGSTDVMTGRVPVQVSVQDGVVGQQQVYYAAARNPGAYPTAEMQGGGSTDVMTGRVPVQVTVQDGVVGQQQVYYAAARNPGAYPTSEMQGGGGTDVMTVRASQSH